MKDALERVRGLARIARRVDLFPYESHRPEEARRLVRPMIERLLLVALEDVALLERAITRAAPPAPDDWLFDEAEGPREDPRTRELIDLCELIRLELSQRLELLHSEKGAELWEFLTACNHARGALIKAAVSLEEAVCARERLPVQLDALHETDSALRVRAGYRRLQRVLAEGSEPAREEIGARLTSAAGALESLVASALFVELRVADRCQLRRVVERLEDWLRAGEEADPDDGMRLWQDLCGLAAMMQQVNNRQELIAHDRALLLEALEELYSDAPLDPAREARLRERLADAVGRDAELDGLLEAGAPLGSVAVLRAVTRAALRLEPQEAQRIVIGR
ncbi:MAG: hypothetical protein MUC67_12915 [Acidobacteria bacterium]|nr:hypothetical protein [Acidobacteriota bacterium]MCU0254205.1 hypothetical protein [Acidobacteriota bacterium]